MGREGGSGIEIRGIEIEEKMDEGSGGRTEKTQII